METILKKLSEEDDYGTILRAKGMVEGTDGTWIYFDMCPARRMSARDSRNIPGGSA